MQENPHTRDVKPFHTSIVAVGGGIAFILDRWLKYTAVSMWPSDATVTANTPFALVVHKNAGIAFSIPVNMSIVIGVSIMIGVMLTHMLVTQWHVRPDRSSAAILVLLGGVGNIIDRITYGYTVDYLLLASRLAINVSDVLIVAGVVWLLFGEPRRQTHVDTTTTAT